MAESETTRLLAVEEPSDMAAGYLAPGSQVGSYVIIDLISDGGCGSVYRAKHSLLGRAVAIKVLRREFSDTNSSMSKRFLLEALAVNMIRHPNIVDVFEFGQFPDGRPYYVMEHLEGNDLDTAIRGHGRYTPAEALAFLEPVCEALEAAHRAGFVHRDIKASNVHVGRTMSGKPVVKLLDFGVAKALNPANPGAGLTVAGARIGTTSAMAPEQVRGGNITPVTDIYALGVLLFRVIVGRNPFASSDPNEVEQMHLTAAAPRPSEFVPVSPEVDAVVLKAMQKKPQDRFQSALQFLEALKLAAAANARPTLLEGRAVGILVDLKTADDADDSVMADVLACLDIVEPALIEAGYSMILQTGSAILAVKPLPEKKDSPLDRLLRANAIALAERLSTDLGRRETSEVACHVNISVHASSAHVRVVGDTVEVEGGAIIDITGWAPAADLRTVYVTEEASLGL